jgi:urea carboxylase-associated protein 1
MEREEIMEARQQGDNLSHVHVGPADVVVLARGHLALEVRSGQTISIVDLHGAQAVDFICYNKENPAEEFWAAHTAKLNRTIYITKGHVLYSDFAHRMATIVDDSVGVNDLICGSCSLALDEVRYGQERAGCGCMDNFEESIKPWGLTRRDIPMCFNIFLNYRVEDDGTVSIDHDPPSGPGDHIDLKAEMDMLVSISNCPQEHNPCTGYNPTAIRVQVSEGGS